MQDFCRSFRRQADQRQKERPPEKKGCDQDREAHAPHCASPLKQHPLAVLIVAPTLRPRCGDVESRAAPCSAVTALASRLGFDLTPECVFLRTVLIRDQPRQLGWP
jgi:hypothetical protein